MPTTTSRADRIPPAPATPRVARLLPTSLAGLAGAACLAGCAIPLLLAAGVLTGAGWAVAGRWLPGVTVLLAVLAAAAWWSATRRRRRAECAAEGDRRTDRV